MRNTEIIVLIVFAILLSIFVFNIQSANQYVTFEEAFIRQNKEVTISGSLNREMPVIYEPYVDANFTKFHLEDSLGNVIEVHLNQDTLYGFSQSETIVLDGYAKGDIFYASSMLLKCPSKYNSENHIIDESK